MKKKKKVRVTLILGKERRKKNEEEEKRRKKKLYSNQKEMTAKVLACASPWKKEANNPWKEKRGFWHRQKRAPSAPEVPLFRRYDQGDKRKKGGMDWKRRRGQRSTQWKTKEPNQGNCRSGILDSKC